jgi:hypothetical protein
MDHHQLLSLSLSPRAHEGACLPAHGADRWRKQAQKAKCENSTCPQIPAPSSGRHLPAHLQKKFGPFFLGDLFFSENEKKLKIL